MYQRGAKEVVTMPDAADRPAADALRASETRLRSILDTAVDAFISINAQGIIEAFNPAAERMFGYAAGDVMGRNVSMLMPRPYCDEHDRYLEHYLATGERKIIGIGREAVARRKDGSEFPIDLAVGEAIVNGERVFTGIVRDLTERKRLEASLLRAQRMEIIGSLAGGIAHDLNNVLAVVLTAAGNLQLDLAAEERQQVLDELMAAARRGTAVVRQVLSFARGAAAGAGPLQPTPLLRDLERLLRHLLPRGVALKTTIPEHLPALVGDEPQLYQVVLNLCVNARDAMPHGGELALSAAVDGERKNVVIRIADTGVGIPPDKLDAIFEPFYTTKPPGQGTGLGLATVRDLVRGQGGRVEVASMVGRGTTFAIHWPILLGDVARPTELPTGHGEMILLADGDRSSTELARAALETYGYRPVAARDSQEAAQLLSGHGSAIRAVVLDRSLPLEPATIRVAAPAARLIGIGPGTGVDARLEKPFTADDLLRTIDRLLHR